MSGYVISLFSVLSIAGFPVVNSVAHGAQPYKYHPKEMSSKACAFDSTSTRSQRSNKWWERFWEPCVNCCNRRRIGRKGDGGKWVCFDVQLKSTYAISVGSNNEFSFERELLTDAGITGVHVFDHTSNPPYPAISGLSFFKEKMTEARLYDTLSGFKRRGKPVSIVKVDCKGCEFGLFSDRVLGAIQEAQAQLLVEVHFPSVNLFSTFFLGKPPPAVTVSRLWRKFVSVGMFPFHKEANIPHTCCVEYAFLPLKRSERGTDSLLSGRPRRRIKH